MSYLNQLKQTIEAILQDIDRTENQYGDLSVREFCKIQRERVLSEYQIAKEEEECEKRQTVKRREALGVFYEKCFC